MAEDLGFLNADLQAEGLGSSREMISCLQTGSRGPELLALW